ncbi:Osmotically-inducible protein OsmY, contains BON domain [Nitrosomonas communis]|uniref:Osmotically-inducible protein OsmY, contains BON domain n=2 Tax=Nitrosomonas communis TaxID=44574 RepID=A0A1I4NTV6_9PROT|nr:Osmotically-inducible protein OsmY, contains BON domain [Nitrosomonas communis]
MKLTHEYRLTISTKKLSMIISLFAIIGLASCQKEGPTERAGKEIDRSAEQTEQKVEQGTEKTESKLDEIKETIVEKTEKGAQYIDDSFITMKVKAAILNDSMLKVTDIKVTTVDGVVQLSGTVDSQQSIDRAMEVAQSQDGVKSVQSDLIVYVPGDTEQKIEQGTESKLDEIKETIVEKTEEGAQYMDDSFITMKVKAAILNDSMLKVTDIKVTTVDGIVQLSGTVDSQQSIDRAIEVAQIQDGVKSVESDLIVDVSDSAEQKVEQGTEKTESKLDEKTEESAQYMDDPFITMKVKTAILNDSMLLKVADIKVSTVDGVVKLSGTVDSQQIIDRAIEVAQSQDGVKSVQNDLVLDTPND